MFADLDDVIKDTLSVRTIESTGSRADVPGANDRMENHVEKDIAMAVEPAFENWLQSINSNSNKEFKNQCIM